MCEAKFEDEQNRKSGQIEVSERFFEKISRNMTDTE